MLREGWRLALSDFAKVAAHSGLLKARAESKWHRVAALQHQTIPCVRWEIRFARTNRFIVRADEMLTAFLEIGGGGSRKLIHWKIEKGLDPILS
jgi:hypothetical protein